MKPSDLWTERVKCLFCGEEQLVFLDVVGIKTQMADDKESVVIKLDVQADALVHKCMHFVEKRGYLD